MTVVAEVAERRVAHEQDQVVVVVAVAARVLATIRDRMPMPDRLQLGRHHPAQGWAIRYNLALVTAEEEGDARRNVGETAAREEDGGRPRAIFSQACCGA